MKMPQKHVNGHNKHTKKKHLNQKKPKRDRIEMQRAFPWSDLRVRGTTSKEASCTQLC